MSDNEYLKDSQKKGIEISERMSGSSFGQSIVRTKSKSRFWNKIALRYSKTPIKHEADYQKKLEITRQYLRPNMSLLEFGCGTGSTALVHAPYVDHITAIDFSARMIEIAQRKADAGNVPNVTFRQSGIEEFDAPGEAYDVILGLSILHLLENRQAVIAKVHDLLKPGGIFVSSTACIADIMPLIKYIAPAGRMLRLLPFIDIFTLGELVEDIKSAGFDIEVQWQPDRKKAVFIVARKAL